MQYHFYTFQKISLVFVILLHSFLQAEEETQTHPNIYEDLKLKVQNELENGKLTGLQKQQAYDIIGNLGLCQPVIKTVLEHSSPHQEPSPAIEMPQAQPSVESQTPHPSLTEESTLQKFDALKHLLIQQLSKNEIASEYQESAYTLIGSINLCRPVLKGAELLSAKIETEMKDQKESSLLAHPEASTSYKESSKEHFQ